MPREKIITAIDVGSSTLRVGCALIKEGTNPQLVGVGESVSVGVRRGQIVDIGEVVSSLEESLREAERTSGFSISKVVVSVGGPQIELTYSSGSIAVSRADGEIAAEDIRRVLEAAQAISLPPNKKIIHVLPLFYTVDNDTNIENPLGMKGVRLELKSLLVLSSQPVLKTLAKAVEQTGRKVEAWVYGPLAVARAILSKKQIEAGMLLVNLGASTTTLSVFKERELVSSNLLSIGATNITHDIAIGLRCAIDVAERVKIEYGSCFTPNVSKREQVVLADWGIEDVNIPRYALAQIIEARNTMLFDVIQKEVRKYLRTKTLPAGIVLTGGGANMSGIVELVKRQLKLPVQIGRPKEIESELGEAFNPAYSTVVGSILWAYDQELSASSTLLSGLEGRGAWDKTKEWLKELLP